MNKLQWKEHLLAFFTIFIWGITFINTRILEDSFSALEILFVRYAIAYIALWIICPKFMPFSSWKEEAYLLVASASGTGIYQYLENLSVSYTSPASVSFITAMAPIFTAIFAHFYLKEEFHRQTLFGMLVALIGVFFISFGDSRTMETGLLGDAIIFAGVWLWAVYSVVVKKIAAFGHTGFQVTRRLFFYALIMMLPFMAVKAKQFPYAALLSWSSVGNFLYLGIFASAICFFTWNRCVERLGATTTSKYLFVMPVITLIGQMVYNRNVIGWLAVLGMALILVGLLVTNIRFGKQKANE